MHLMHVNPTDSFERKLMVNREPQSVDRVQDCHKRAADIRERCRKNIGKIFVEVIEEATLCN